MSDITQILQSIGQGDPLAAEQLMALVYEELRQLARRKMTRERPGHTLQPTALVHEAWLRLIGKDGKPHFQNRAHFFAAAAEAMRRILVERARRQEILRKGGYAVREELEDSALIVAAPDAQLLAIHECLNDLAAEDPTAAELVKLRYFVGLTMPETAEILGMALRTAEEIWTYARAWLRERLEQ
jgi:RNA polymerase sigma factor (TIGR02999 family)